jgi:hypothetical protein
MNKQFFYLINDLMWKKYMQKIEKKAEISIILKENIVNLKKKGRKIWRLAIKFLIINLLYEFFKILFLQFFLRFNLCIEYFSKISFI